MAIDLDHDVLLTLPAFCRLAGNVNLSTAHRWRLRGVNGVKLQCVKIGGKRFVTRRAAEDFIAHCTAAADGTSVELPNHSSRSRQKQLAEAEATCDRAGI